MGKKKNRNGGENRNDNQENQNINQQKEENENQQKYENNDQQKEEAKKNDGGGGKDDPPLLTVVLKMKLHCEGCATKVENAVRRFEGVDSVRTDLGSDKVTVVGRLDPTKLREFVEQKVIKKADQLSPAPKKDKENNNNGGVEKEDGKQEEKKPKELPITTAVMELNLDCHCHGHCDCHCHCQGCIPKIRKTIANNKGFLDLSIDEQKDQVTVKGPIRALTETLKKKMKKPVEIVPPKEEGGDKKDKDSGEAKNEKGGEGNGWENMQKGGGQGGEGGDVGHESQVVFYPVANYEVPALQIFSDENPNACSVM